jgi:hypothetical protein
LYDRFEDHRGETRLGKEGIAIFYPYSWNELAEEACVSVAEKIRLRRVEVSRAAKGRRERIGIRGVDIEPFAVKPREGKRREDLADRIDVFALPGCLGRDARVIAAEAAQKAIASGLARNIKPFGLVGVMVLVQMS